MNIIDTHAHLDMPEFDTDRELVINRAREAGVTKIITIGIDLPSSRKAIALAEKYPMVWASIGVHPQESNGVLEEDILKLAELAQHPRVVAVGELGLDFYRHYVTRDVQLAVLKWELGLARKVRLPIIIHCRQAQAEMLPIIQDWCSSFTVPENTPRGVVHCFSGDLETARTYIDLGFYISLGAYIGYPSSAPLRETIKSLPLNRLVIETDCPFLPPQKHRGQRNEPAYTVTTLGVIAETQQISPEEAALQTTRNATQLFHLPAD